MSKPKLKLIYVSPIIIRFNTLIQILFNMLSLFNKYTKTQNPHINLCNNSKKIISLLPNSVKKKPNLFFRKLFFRTLLLYVNSMNCNFFSPLVYNYFYSIAFVHATYSTEHPGFYFKFMHLY